MLFQGNFCVSSKTQSHLESNLDACHSYSISMLHFLTSNVTLRQMVFIFLAISEFCINMLLEI